MNQKLVFALLLLVFSVVFTYHVFFSDSEVLSGEAVRSSSPGNSHFLNQTNHTACVNNACVIVPGPGSNQCSTHLQCASTNSMNSTTQRVSVPYPASTKRVFVTSTFSTANLGGYNGGVQRCMQLAAAANLGGQWAAWLSVNTNATTIHARNALPNAKYVLLNGQVIAHNKADLIDGVIAHAIDRNEHNQLVTNITRVWTGTKYTGLATGSDCGGWNTSGNSTTGTIGFSSVVNQGWTMQSAPFLCHGQARLYCFER